VKQWSADRAAGDGAGAGRVQDPAGRLLISDAQRHLGHAPVGVDHLLQGVPRQIALNRHKVLNRAAARNPAHRLNVLLQAVLDETEYLLRITSA